MDCATGGPLLKLTDGEMFTFVPSLAFFSAESPPLFFLRLLLFLRLKDLVITPRLLFSFFLIVA